jgi:hypothetical protein
MQVYFLNSLPDFGYSYYIYYLKTDGKYYGWDAQNNKFYNLSTPNIDDLVGLSFENLQEGDVLYYDSASQTWINKVIKQNDLTPSSIKYPTVDAVNTGLSSKQKTITSGTAAPSGGIDGDIYLQYT